MKKNFLKRMLALALAGTLITGSAVTISADEGDVIIPTPELRVDLPNATEGFGQVSATNNLPDIGFNTSRGTLTAMLVREAKFESEDDGHNGFNGVYYFSNSDGVFNMSGRYPMALVFDVKLDESITTLPSSSGDIIGKMNQDYGVQIMRNSGNHSGDCIQVYTNNGGWPTCYLDLDLGTFNQWRSVVVLYDGHTFWISVDGGDTFSSSIPNNNFSLPNHANQSFGIGYNATGGSGNTSRVMSTGIYLDNVKMYRSYDQESADDTAGTADQAVQLAAELMSTGTLAIETEYIAPLYTVGETTWYEGSEAAGTLAETYVPGNEYTFSTTFTARDGYSFRSDNVPVEIEAGYGSIGVRADVASDGRTMTVTGTYSDETLEYDPNVETAFWDREMAAGQINQQTADDIWLYQIKRVNSDVWENIPDTAFYPGYLDGTWMQSRNDDNDEYGWAKINRTEVTSTFAPSGGTAKYQSAAYTWNAYEAGYYRASVATPIGNAGNSFTMYISHATTDTTRDGDILLESAQYSAADTFTSRIAQVEVGDNIRFVATNGWATGFEPVIEQVTVKEYAQQWLDDNAEILASYDDGLYTSDTVEAVTTAKESLDAAIEEEPADLNKIEEALTSLHTAVENLQEREFDFYVQTDYWDHSRLEGTLASQTDDDIWYYQVRTDGVWENIAENYFDSAALEGDGVWMSNGNTTSDPYYYAAIGRTKLTPCLGGTNPDNGVAFAWKAIESGYARVRFANDITLNSSDSKSNVTLTIAKGTASDNTETLLVKELDKSQTYASSDFMTEYVKVSAGDYLRISAAEANNDVFGVAPVIDVMTVKAYAEQYLAEMEDLDTSGKTTSSVATFDEAIENLSSILSDGSAEEAAIVSAIEALEQAEADLEDSVYTVTYIMGGRTEYIKGNFNDLITIVLDTSQIPEEMRFAGWYLGKEEDVIVSTAMEYTFYVVGDVTVTAKFVSKDSPLELQPAASISNVNVTERDDGKFDAQFIGHLTVPEGYTLNATGLLWSPSEISKTVLNETEGPQIGDAQIKQVDVSKVSSAYQFSVTVKSVPVGRTVHAVSFAKVTNNETQDVKWIYSSGATATAE